MKKDKSEVFMNEIRICFSVLKMFGIQAIIGLFVSIFAISCGNNEKKTLPPKKVNVKIKSEIPQQKTGLIYPYILVRSKKQQFDDARVRIGDSVIISTYKGKIVLTDSSGNSKKQIADLKCEYMMDNLYVLPRSGNKWFFVWQETNHEGQKSSLAVFSEGSEKPEWKISFPYGNVGPAVIDQNMVYFTAMGTVAKIDISTGKLIWKQDSLFNPLKLSYKKFYTPSVFDDKVIFVDYPEPGRREKRDTLILDPSTGKRLR
ncbi:hypothetical protein BH09BAC5_BH09BAC5_09000 [soil metagenome]